MALDHRLDRDARFNRSGTLSSVRSFAVRSYQRDALIMRLELREAIGERELSARPAKIRSAPTSSNGCWRIRDFQARLSRSFTRRGSGCCVHGDVKLWWLLGPGVSGESDIAREQRSDSDVATAMLLPVQWTTGRVAAVAGANCAAANCAAAVYHGTHRSRSLAWKKGDVP